MKKLLISIGLAATLTSSAIAGAWQSPSFLASGVQAITVTNTIGITNFLTSGAYSTNWPGTVITNNLGVRYIDTNGVLGNLLVDYLPIPRDSEGRGLYVIATNHAIASGYNPSMLDVTIRLVGGSGADAAAGLVFTFTPVYGKGADVEGATGDQWIVGVTPTTTTALTVVTNVPLWRWPGAAGIRLRRVHNTDTDAAANVQIYNLTLDGWRE